MRRDEATIHDVARAAAVSIATVSRAINGKGRMRDVTRARVRRIAGEMGFEPNGLATSLRRRRSFTVGLLSNDVHGRFAMPLLGGVEEALSAARNAVFLCNAADDAERGRLHLQSLVGRRIDGLIVTARRMDSPFAGQLALPDLPVVHANVRPAADGVAVLSDDRQGGRLGTAHLLGLGRRRLAHVTGPWGFEAVRERFAGFCEALAAGGLEPVEPLCGTWSEAWGAEAVERLLAAGDRPDAIVCGSDQIARGVADALRDAGVRVPDDVALVGFDNWRVLAEACRPGLTTVDPCLDALGARAGRLLMRMIEGDAPDAMVERVPCKLVVRASCGA